MAPLSPLRMYRKLGTGGREQSVKNACQHVANVESQTSSLIVCRTCTVTHLHLESGLTQVDCASVVND